MAWKRNNSELNPKVTVLPNLTNYVEGSLTVLTAPYGDIEYIVKNNTWIPNRALTDITINVSSSGVDSIQRGSEAQPVQTLQYVMSIIPKKIKNLTIKLLDIDDSSSHNGYGQFYNFEKIDPNNKITIIGRTIGPMESFMLVNASNTCFNSLLRKIGVDDSFEYSTYTKTIKTVSAYGTDPETGWNYIDVNNYNFRSNKFYIGQVVYNETNLAYSFISKIEQNGTVGRLYLLDTIFGVVGQQMAGIFPSDEMKFVECIDSIDPEKIGIVWPVLSMSYNAVILPETPSYILSSGDVIQGVSLPRGTFVFNNVNLDVDIKKINHSFYSDVEEDIFTTFKDCDGFINFSQSRLTDLFVTNSPNIAFSKTILRRNCYIERCFSTLPKYIDYETFDTTDNKDINNETYMNSDLNGGIIIASSIIYPDNIVLEKSSVSIKHSIISGIEQRVGDPSLERITLKDSYLQLDSTSIVSNFIEEPPTILVGENSNIDMKNTDKINLFDVSNPYKIDTTSGFYKELNFKTYETRDQMLEDILIPNGILGNVITEPGNLYLRQENKWVVITGNKYATVDMPTSPDFTLPDGLEIFDLTLNKEVTWRN